MALPTEVILHRRLSVPLTILTLAITTALAAGPASASITNPDGGGGAGGGGGGGSSDPCELYGPETCADDPGDQGGAGSGSGGARGSELPVPLSMPSPQAAQAIVNSIRAVVKKTLVEKPRCFDTLSLTDSRLSEPRNPITVLDTVYVLFENSADSAAAYASGDGVGGTIGILPGFFFLNIDRRGTFGFVDPDVYFDLPTVQVSATDLQIIAMLHELGHLTGVNVHPDAENGYPTPGNVNATFNSMIYVNCLDQGAALQ